MDFVGYCNVQYCSTFARSTADKLVEVVASHSPYAAGARDLASRHRQGPSQAALSLRKGVQSTTGELFILSCLTIKSNPADLPFLQQTWRKSSSLSTDEEAAETVELQLQELTHIIADESQRPLPHPCITFASAKQIYIPVGKIATTSYNEWIIRESVAFFATLIESEEEAFVESDSFATSLTNLLVRITGANSIRLGQETETRVVELAFNITTKIRLEPEILPAWFKTHDNAKVATGEKDGEKGERDEREKFAGRTQKQDFPLFYLLIDYIHHEGKVGDFARTGLLYIIEAASHSVDLEQWIVESDLSTLMATGLGALYSQLSRKLVIDHPAQSLPPVLAFSDYQHPSPTLDIVSSCSPDFQAHLDTFLSHLLFWQDVLNHCRSVEVKSTLLEHFQIIFLQQLLYPSLLESSDIDGGSSVAVLTYLRRILESLDHPDMINLILHYLLALPDILPTSAPPTRTSVSAARKRKSMDLKSMMASQTASDATPMLFNLVDLIRACLRSQSSQTIFVTLQLVSAILKRHHRYAVITLLHTESVPSDATFRTIGGHEQEVEFLMHLAGIIGGQDNFDEQYENVLRDTMVRVEAHPCSLRLIDPKAATQTHKMGQIAESLPGAPRDVQAHTLRPDDILLNLLLDRVETFFLNHVDANLALTEAIFDLAVCGYIHVEGWMLRNPQTYTFDDTDETQASPYGTAQIATPESPTEAHIQLQAVRQCRRRPIWTSSSLPRLLTVLEHLTSQIDSYRTTVPRFDDLLQQRREAFQTADFAPDPNSASTSTPMPGSFPTAPTAGGTGTPANATPVPMSRTKNLSASGSSDLRRGSSEDTSRTASPARPSVLEGFAQRMFAEITGSPGSRGGTPRGRKGEFGTPGKALPALPRDGGFDTPTKSGLGGLGRSYSPSSKGEPVASQVAAFQAIDQSILARRVGMPRTADESEGVSKGGKKIEPVKLSYEKKAPMKEPLNDAPKESDARASENGEEAASGAHAAQSTAEQSDLRPDSSVEGSEATLADEKTATVSHVITNVIILQSFLFELAALIQVRAGLFDEVRFV
jgi:hypothetical protein